MSVVPYNPWSHDWRYYEIPWNLQPAPPWDVTGAGAGGSGGIPPAPAWPPYSSIQLYNVTVWANRPIPIKSIDPFGGWTAQDETTENEMRPAVPGLTSP
jgi:hypothetical protein